MIKMLNSIGGQRIERVNLWKSRRCSGYERAHCPSTILTGLQGGVAGENSAVLKLMSVQDQDGESGW
jgi:hypothetical protein